MGTMGIMSADIAGLAAEYAERPPQDILALAFERFDKIAISFSGAEDVVLVDMAAKLRPDVLVLSLDTGRLHGETYQFIDKVREHYRVPLHVLSPDTVAVERLVREKGLFSFFRDGHAECCSIRKVAPLRRALGSVDAWISGLRKDQNRTRTEVPVVQEDGGFSTADHMLVKFNPIASWSSADVWRYIRANNVPFNTLHERGYTSIGCEPCTRPVLPNQHERDGRWWWEESAVKECGLHVGSLKAPR